MYLPAGQRAQVSIYSDSDDHPVFRLATSDVVSYEHNYFEWDVLFTFPPSERILLDRSKWYWLVMEFLDVDESTTEEVGELVYFHDPYDRDTPWEWNMRRLKYDDESGIWDWDDGPGVDVGVLKFRVGTCKVE